MAEAMSGLDGLRVLEVAETADERPAPWKPQPASRGVVSVGPGLSSMSADRSTSGISPAPGGGQVASVETTLAMP